MTNSISRKCGCILQLTHRGRRFSCWNRSSLLDFHADWNLHWSFVTFGNVFYESGLYMSCASSFLNFSAPSYIVHFVFVHPSECCHWQGGHCSSAFWRHLGFVFELLLFDLESSVGTLLPWESPSYVKNSSKFGQCFCIFFVRSTCWTSILDSLSKFQCVSKLMHNFSPCAENKGVLMIW